MTLKNFLCYTPLVVFIAVGQAFAQVDSVRVRIFDGTEQPLPSEANFDKNFARLNYYLIARGALTIGIERILHDKHAVTLDAGLTYRDFIYEILFRDDFAFDGVDVKAGTYVEVAYKFYPRRYHNFDGGLYLSPGFITRNYNISSDVNYYDNSNYRSQKVAKDYGMREAYLKFGYVAPGRSYDDLIIDYYVGFGLRYLTSSSYEIRQIGSGSQRIVPTEKTESVPAMYIGIRVGLAF
jgi:hypothetical protein